MSNSKYHNDEDITLVDTIRKISGRVRFSGSEQDAEHSRFLRQVIEEMEAEVLSIRQRRTLASRS